MGTVDKREILPALDSPEMAKSRRRELSLPRNVAAELGREAVEAEQRGHYFTEDGEHVDWAEKVKHACESKISIPPDAVLPEPQDRAVTRTRVQVTNEATLGAAARLTDNGARPLALNFANGIHPGGGFLHGARAQEEVLCRSSALYATLERDPMYDAHRQRPLPDSTDWAILSPDAPVFRTDDGTTLKRPWLLSFLTCAAPYAPALDPEHAADLLAKRIRRVLDIARCYGYSELVLGAWGCGAFQNDSHRTAQDFRTALETDFAGVFSEIVFAVVDWSPERRYLGPFAEVFSQEQEESQ